MALETLKGVKEIGGFEVVVMDELREKYPDKFGASGAMDWQWFEKDIRPNHFIYVRMDKNSISFTLQNGPVKEAGVNGCQVDTLIAAAEVILGKLNEKFPSGYNTRAMAHLSQALENLNARKRDREARGVEGKSEA